MKILYVAPYAPGHIRVRSFHLLSQLLHSGHRVTLAYPDRRGDPQSRVDELRAQGAAVVTQPISVWRRGLNSALALLLRRPMQARYAWSPRLAGRLSAAVERDPPDLVHVEHLRAVEYAHALDRGGRNRSWATVWDSVDSISALLSQTRVHSRSSPWRLAASLDLEPTRRYERQALADFDRVLCASEADRLALRVLDGDHGSAEPCVLTQGVDLEAFSFSDPLDRHCELVFSGAMGYHPNVAAALHLVERVMPRVWAQRRDVGLVIVGPNAPRSLRRAAAGSAGQVRFTGWVTEVRPHLVRAAVAAIPLRYGTGVQNKLLEAMACGTPVVTDPRTAEAIGAMPGQDLLTAESDESFAHQVVTLLTEPTLRVRLARNARRRVESSFSWQVVVRELEQHYRQALAARG